jgi:hypothetical protein
MASIRILGKLWEYARSEALASSDESVAFLTANCFETSDKIIFLAESLVPARPKDYLHKSELRLEVSPLYISRVLNVAEDKGCTVIMVHSHPFETGKPRYSVTDDHGEARTSETISKCLEKNPPVGSLLFGQNSASARAWLGPSKKKISAAVTILDGKRYQSYKQSSEDGRVDRDFLDRQVRALGNQTQAELESLEVGIVGLGGTGSSVAEQLCRMGVKKFWLVDHDEFEPSNWSRLYGSTWKDAVKGKLKVDLVSSHLQKINPQISCETIPKSVMRRDVLRSLSTCDIIFSCLDRHAPRAVLNELSYQCFIPVIDVGVGLIRNAAGVLGGSARATIIGPGLPCLICQEIVRPEMITAEHLSPKEYASRRAEGYVDEIGANAPSVVSYTTLASSLGLILFLDFISGNDSDSFSTLLFDLGSKETMKLRSNVKKECVCQKRLGKGFHIPFSVAD